MVSRTGHRTGPYPGYRSLSVKMPGQQVLNGFDGYDVVIPQEEAASYISICSKAALNSLVFTNASFVCQ